MCEKVKISTELLAGHLAAQQDSTPIDSRACQTREVFTKANPSVRIPRAETRLTVYRSPLVGLFSVERACMKLDLFFQVLVMFLMQMCL